VSEYYCCTANRDEHVGHMDGCMLWWKAEGRGYTTNLDEAGIFTETDREKKYPHPERCHYVPREIVDARSKVIRLAWWSCGDRSPICQAWTPEIKMEPKKRRRK